MELLIPGIRTGTSLNAGSVQGSSSSDSHQIGYCDLGCEESILDRKSTSGLVFLSSEGAVS